MADWIEFAPPHSMILIVGSKAIDVPQSFSGQLIVATNNCVAVGCRAEDDGPSRFTLDTMTTICAAAEPAFVAFLDTPEGVVALETVFGDRIAERQASTPTSQVAIWVNHPYEPDEILVAIVE